MPQVLSHKHVEKIAPTLPRQLAAWSWRPWTADQYPDVLACLDAAGGYRERVEAFDPPLAEDAEFQGALADLVALDYSESSFSSS